MPLGKMHQLLQEGKKKDGADGTMPTDVKQSEQMVLN